MDLLQSRIAVLILAILLLAQVLPLPAGGCSGLPEYRTVCGTRIQMSKRLLVTDSQEGKSIICDFDEIKVDSPFFWCYTSHCN